MEVLEVVMVPEHHLDQVLEDQVLEDQVLEDQVLEVHLTQEWMECLQLA